MEDKDFFKLLVKRVTEIVVKELCYVCRHQEHLAYSCPEQAKRECQKHDIDVRFMKISDNKRDGSKDDLKMKVGIDNNNNDMNDDVKTDINAKAALNRTMISTIVNNKMTIRKEMVYAKLIGYQNRSKPQKSCDNWDST
ncbi:23766_t:CDS:2 [Dentiscutata erythropus]|uniref:23766_t:CDS:1 n=1 Tax=Dentiscutata erythropus TaxID=1348616 RepID=A0A9N9NCW3_9GLOM|nr:23766_t:CDS:2 [Dentiscutata erythropus]